MGDVRSMIGAARNALIHVMQVVPQDRVLIISDNQSTLFSDAFSEAASSCYCHVLVASLPEQGRPLQEVPAKLLAAIADATVVITVFRVIAEEVPFRVSLCLAIESRPVRFGHAVSITEAMMTGGPMNVDYRQMRAAADSLVQAFAGAVSVHITSPAGTNLVLRVSGREFRHEVLATNDTPVNLPCGEVYCAPVEDGADGVLVVDGTAGDLGLVTEPVRITVSAGRIDTIECSDQDLLVRIEQMLSIDDQARVIGELGIGVNPGASLVGIMLEDEKAFRTAHIAFGNNVDMPGGSNQSATHVDLLFHRPTIEVSYQDGSSRELLRDGDILDEWGCVDA
jgi:leucyl aminopeptidase (aminopeptidase T)